MIPLSWYLIVAALLFAVGLFGAFSRKNAIAVLMGIELMLNAVNINLIAFWRYLTPENISGQIFAAMVFVVAAAEVAVGLALIMSIYRNKKTIVPSEIDLMKW
jgi:NADH:ubiquinone oxidoreductase subunit K